MNLSQLIIYELDILDLDFYFTKWYIIYKSLSFNIFAFKCIE